MTLRAILLCAGCCIVAAASSGQSLANLKTSFDGEKMVIIYDLLFAEPGQKFKVSFYSSHDNYSRPLSLLTGDAGESVNPGQGNRVVWDAKNTLPADFDADITIKIKVSKGGTGASNKLTTKALDKGSYKKGESLTLRWSGGNTGGKVNVTLYKDGARQQVIADKISNSQEYTWVVPKKGLSGKGYTLRVTNAANETELSDSQPFGVKSKIPMLLIIPAVVLVGVTTFVVTSGGSEPPPEQGEDELPGPVKPN